MENYLERSLFVYEGKGKTCLKTMLNNPLGVEIFEAAFEDFCSGPETYLRKANHVVVSGSIPAVKKVIELAAVYGFSMGILPLTHQKELIHGYGLQGGQEKCINTALSRETQKIDLIHCNGNLVLFKASFGRVPLLDSTVKAGFLRQLTSAFKRFRHIKLLGFEFTTASGRKINTAAAGGIVIQHQTGILASRLIGDNSSLSDGMISLVVSAPISVIEYLRMIFHILIKSPFKKYIASTVGLIKSSVVEIKSEKPLDVLIDDQTIEKMPVKIVVSPEAVSLNTGLKTADFSKTKKGNEAYFINNLPLGKEVVRSKNRGIPFFSYASEERFKDLFTSLYDDAQINTTYIVLMILSTLIATLGLYLNSSSIIIGAMLLAPLMGPIVSLAMGVLRRNMRILQASLIKICVGVLLALCASALFVKLFPYEPVTSEMTARLNPSLLDLLVAVLAGIGGAYTKSFKEILQSLAGVAIAVALVPPLAVAGIGFGRGDMAFFSQAFLLFFTNFVGIVISASFTFRILGYSSAIQAKKGLAVLFILMGLILFPLYLSYQQIVTTYNVERLWKQERFLVSDKYIIVKDAHLIHKGSKKIIHVTILARDQLSRWDLALLNKKIQPYFSESIEIRAEINYIF
jgi:uncharacterized hydrophobic protein (TIGR00271 family)